MRFRERGRGGGGEGNEGERKRVGETQRKGFQREEGENLGIDFDAG